jgi:hypothetical protein
MAIPFAFPAVNSTVAVTGTSQRIALAGSGNTVVVKNAGSTECFIAVGDVTVVATAGAGSTAASDGSFSILPGEIAAYTIPLSATYLAAICAGAGTTTLRVARGEGA